MLEICFDRSWWSTSPLNRGHDPPLLELFKYAEGMGGFVGFVLAHFL